MKVIITGATGMIGKDVLLECLDHSAVREVLVIGRNRVGMQHDAKLKVIPLLLIIGIILLFKSIN